MKDSNLRMPESKSGALTSLANPHVFSSFNPTKNKVGVHSNNDKVSTAHPGYP